MIESEDFCIICGTEGMVDCTMRCSRCANEDVITSLEEAPGATGSIALKIDARAELKAKLKVISRGSLGPSKRTFRVIVPKEFECKHPACPSPDRLYVEFTIGRNIPTIRWENAPTNLGVELLISDELLLSAVEDVVADYIRDNDRAFFERYFNSK